MRVAAILAVLGGIVLGVPASAAADCVEPCSWNLCRTQQDADRWALVEAARSEEPAAQEGFVRYVVTAVHGGPGAPSVAIGQIVDTWEATSARALFVLAGDFVGGALEVDGADRVHCAQSGGSATRGAAIEAALSGDCVARANAAGLTNECRDVEGGCAAAQGDAAAGAVVAGSLLALLSVSRRSRMRAA